MNSLLASLLVTITALATQAAEPTAPWEDRPVTLPAWQKDLTAQSNGATYRVFAYQPETEPPAEGFPVLYLLDGNATFPSAVTLLESLGKFTARYGITPGLIVGIGYPTDSPIDLAARSRDYTPPAAGLLQNPTAQEQGGADLFLDFIEKELKPALAQQFPIDASRQSFFGHSFGGLLTLHSYFTRPTTFQNYIAASPSIWWQDRAIILEKEEALGNLTTSRTQTEPKLLVTVGALEQTPSQDPRFASRNSALLARRQVDNARDLVRDLSERDLPASFLLFPDENHGSARLPALQHALRLAFQEDNPSPTQP